MPPPLTTGGPYWANWDIARDFAFLPDGSGGYVLDGYGGLHSFRVNGKALPPAASTGAYWAGRDMARRVVIFSDGTGGYVLDVYGGIHGFGIGKTAPVAVKASGYWANWNIIRDFVLPMNLRAIPVVSGDRLVGLITIADLRKVEQDRWATTPVEQVMTPASELATVSPDDPLGTALERFGGTEIPLLLVVKDGRLIGVLYREAVIGYVRMQEMLAPQGRR